MKLATKLATKLVGSGSVTTHLLIGRPIPFAAIVQRGGTKFRHPSTLAAPRRFPRRRPVSFSASFAFRRTRTAAVATVGSRPSRVADSRGRGCARTWLDKNMLRRADERDRPTRSIRSAETERAARFDETRSRDCGKTRNEFQRESPFRKLRSGSRHFYIDAILM